MPEFLPSELLQKFLPLADDAGNLVAKGINAVSPAVVSPAQPNLQQTLVQRAMTRDAGQTIGAKDPRTFDVAFKRDDPFSSPDFLQQAMQQLTDPGNWMGPEAEAAAPIMAGARHMLPEAVEHAAPVAEAVEHGLPQKAMFEYPHPAQPAPPTTGSTPAPNSWTSYDEDSMWGAMKDALERQSAGTGSSLKQTAHPSSAADDLKTIGEAVAAKGSNNLFNYGLPTTPSASAPDLHQVMLQKRLQAAQNLTTPPLMPSHAQGPQIPGNIDPFHRPELRFPLDDDGLLGTASYGKDGKEVLIPTTYEDLGGTGAVRHPLTNAITHANTTGQNLGTFGSPEQADAYAKDLDLAVQLLGRTSRTPPALSPVPSHMMK